MQKMFDEMDEIVEHRCRSLEILEIVNEVDVLDLTYDDAEPNTLDRRIAA